MGFTIGQTIGDYRVVEVIGAGGMGTVYKVQHLISERTEAMKVILAGLVDTPELADRFIREIKVQARLSHPNITALHNALRADGQFLMVMEFVDGTSLHARLRAGKLGATESSGIAQQILSALGYAHSQSVVHRDIKPANVMITRDGTVKLMDFGIARGLNDQHLTRAGAAVGSIYYMSPEQVRGGEVDGRSDLYSLGVVLYEMATGVRPISGDSSWAVMNAHLSEIPRSPSVVDSSVPTALSAVILRALEKDPAHRFQTAAEFGHALQSIAQSPVSGASRPVFAEIETLLAAQPSSKPPEMVRTPQLRSVSVAEATPTPSAASSSMGSGVRFDPEGISRLVAELAAYVGPMAKVLVSRAAKKATSWKQLYDTLAAEVPEGAERKRFLAKRPL